MRTKLFVNGCSFLRHRHTKETNINFSPAELIKAHGKFESLINLAEDGRGNDRVLMTTMQHFERHPKRKQDTFVMIGWSASTRLDFPSAYYSKPTAVQGTIWSTIQIMTKTHLFDEMAKTKKTPINYPDWMTIRYFQNVLGLQNYLKQNNIPYIFYNSLAHAFHGARDDQKFLINAIDQKRFYNLLNSQYEYCTDNNLFVSKSDEHPNKQGHTEWADKLCNYIDTNKLYEDQNA
tara:strand:+ start:524 stop:1225 length:702 start_codon:yes stop_codon:yes gene_type:complete